MALMVSEPDDWSLSQMSRWCVYTSSLGQPHYLWNQLCPSLSPFPHHPLRQSYTQQVWLNWLPTQSVRMYPRHHLHLMKPLRLKHPILCKAHLRPVPPSSAVASFSVIAETTVTAASNMRGQDSHGEGKKNVWPADKYGIKFYTEKYKASAVNRRTLKNLAAKGKVIAPSENMQ